MEEKLIRALVAIGMFVMLAVYGWQAVTQLTRIADALNESNHIMVGVENGQVPGPGQFQKSAPAKEF